MAFIELREVWQRRQERDLLKRVNLGIERGKVHALIGSTGAGKTTLLRIIALLDYPSAGEVVIDGVSAAQPERVRLELRRRMAFVLQKPVVFNTSVYENIAYGMKWRGWKKPRIREKVGELLEIVDLADYRDRNARTLSGGEMQRVAVARAIAAGPEILLLDEPTANLDPLSEAKIEEVMQRIIRQYNMTVVMATHDMDQGQHLADCISVLDNGEILQTGDPHDVFFRPVNRHVAAFVGMDNILEGMITSCREQHTLVDVRGTTIETVADCNIGDRVLVCLRPEDVTISLEPQASSARNTCHGKISATLFTGPLCRVEIDCGFPMVSLVTRRSAEEMQLRKGMDVYATFKAVAVHVIAP